MSKLTSGWRTLANLFAKEDPPPFVEVEPVTAAPVDDDGSATYDFDWLGKAFTIGAMIVYPSEAYGSTKQMTLAQVVGFRDNGGITVNVDRRSRTGKPKPGYDKVKVHLTAVGLANVTVVG